MTGKTYVEREYPNLDEGLKGMLAIAFDEGVKQIQRAYELGKSELEKENAELEQKLEQTEKDLADYQFNYPTIKELEKENTELKAKEKQIEKVEYTLKKIIETVHNDRIDYYAERLVLINDFANECLQEIK